METRIWNNELSDYLIVVIVIVFGLLAVRLFRRTIVRWLGRLASRSSSTLDDFIVQGISRTLLPLLDFGIVYFALKSLELAPWLCRALDVAGLFLWIFLITRMVSLLLHYLLRQHLRRQGHGEERFQQLRGVMMIVSGLLWIIAFLFLINNLGYNVATLLTGLGIGGIAIALATQNIIADLFNYFVLFFDRPFEVGDFVVVDDKSGTVEAIGIKTTRIRALSGEQLVVSNTDLANSRLHNYKRLARRRVVFSIGVTYDTSADQLRKIPDMIREAVTRQPDTQFDRAHFQSYGDSALLFEAVYVVLSADFNRYMDIQQAVNLYLFETFEREGIAFAYPTQTIIVHRPAITR